MRSGSTPLDADEEAAVIAAAERGDRRGRCGHPVGLREGGARRRGHRGAIARARARGIPVYVDPKSDDFRRYRGATCITPNLQRIGVGGADAGRAPRPRLSPPRPRSCARPAADAILGTRSEKGMALVEASGEVHFEAARAREVFDVSGAGDTVIAVLALAVRRGYPLAAGDAPRQHRRRHRRQQARHRDRRTRRIDARTVARCPRQGMAPRQILQRRRGRDAGARGGRSAGSRSALPMAASTSCMPGMSPCWRRRGRNATG